MKCHKLEKFKLTIHFTFKSWNIPFPQYLKVIFKDHSVEKLTFRFPEIDNYKFTCDEQYYVASLLKQTPICKFVAYENSTNNEKAMKIYNLTIKMNNSGNMFNYISELPFKDQNATAIATLHDEDSKETKSYVTYFNLIFIDKNFPLSFPYTPGKVNPLSWVDQYIIFIQVTISKFIKEFTIFSVLGKLQKKWNYADGISISSDPHDYKINILIEIFAKNNGKSITKFTLFNNSYVLHFYTIDKKYIQNYSIESFTNEKFSCESNEIYDLSMQPIDRNNDKFFNIISKQNVLYGVVLKNWPENYTIIFICSYMSKYDGPDITNVVLVSHQLSIKKSSIRNCRIKPNRNLISLPFNVNWWCECKGNAHPDSFSVIGNCTVSFNYFCFYILICNSYNNLNEIHLKFTIISDGIKYYLNYLYKRVYLPWYISYTPSNPFRGEIIKCFSNVNYLKLQYSWKCMVQSDVDPDTYRKYYMTKKNKLKFSLYAPDLVHFCLCSITHKQKESVNTFNISKLFHILLKEKPLERCELERDKVKPATLYLAYSGIQILIFLTLVLIFPLIAYHMTDKYKFNLKRKQILLSLGIREIIDFNKESFKPLFISKNRIEEDVYNRILNLSYDASKKAEMLRNLREKMVNISDSRSNENDVLTKENEASYNETITKEVRSIIKQSMRIEENDKLYISRKLEETLKKKKDASKSIGKSVLKDSMKVKLEYKPKTNYIKNMIKMMELEAEATEKEKSREIKKPLFISRLSRDPKKIASADQFSMKASDSILKDVRKSSNIPKMRFTISTDSDGSALKTSLTQKDSLKTSLTQKDSSKFSGYRSILFKRSISSDEQKPRTSFEDSILKSPLEDPIYQNRIYRNENNGQ